MYGGWSGKCLFIRFVCVDIAGAGDSAGSSAGSCNSSGSCYWYW